MKIFQGLSPADEFSSLTVNQHEDRDCRQAEQAHRNNPRPAHDPHSAEHEVADVVRLQIRVLQLEHHGTVGNHAQIPVLRRVLGHFGAVREKTPRLVT